MVSLLHSLMILAVSIF